MARQKEHLAAQQSVNLRSAQLGGIMPNQLQHHSSAHSLHSQPSFGSITSPGGYQPSPTQGPGVAGPGHIENAFRPGVVPGLGPIGPGMDMMGNVRDEDVSGLMDRLNLGRGGQPPFGAAPGSFAPQHSDATSHAQNVVSMLNDRARLQREQAEHDALQRLGLNDQHAAQASAERLQQFGDLRLQTDLEQSRVAPPPEGVIGKPSAPSTQAQEHQSEPESPEDNEAQEQLPESLEEVPSATQEPLSLTEQVQKAQSAKQSPAPQSAWKPVEPAIYPFPPAPSQSPLPAPAAQRKAIVPGDLHADSRAATPAADTPSASIAPWAKEPTEASRGPSLREIQEAEAKKAAEREALAAAARREAFEKELQAQTQSPVVQPGLPSSSTWASGATGSPATPAPAAGASAWAKPAAGKAPAQPTPASKKTLSQIQKEEEARKNRAAAQAASAASAVGAAVAVSAAGKRYADLASKQTPALPAAAMVAGASPWTTVGASGKVKAPGGPASPAPAPAVRATSTTAVPSILKKPTITRTTTIGGASGKANAEEEFRKWLSMSFARISTRESTPRTLSPRS